MDALILRDEENPLQFVEGEPRLLDIVLAERLGFDRPRNIRTLIDRNLSDLEQRYGQRFTVKRSYQGQEYTEYWLNEAWALRLCTLSQAARAQDVTEILIKWFLAAKNGLVRPTENGLVPFRQLQQDMVEVKDLLTDVKADVSQVKSELAGVKGELCEFKQVLTNYVNSRRVDFSHDTQFQMLKATRDHPTLQGRCLYCHEVEVVDSSYCIPIKNGRRVAQFEHAENRNDHAFDNCSIPCNGCHDKKHHPAKYGERKGWWRDRFNAFHQVIREKGYPEKTDKPPKPENPNEPCFPFDDHPPIKCF